MTQPALRAQREALFGRAWPVWAAAVVVATINHQNSFLLQARAVDAGTEMPNLPIKIYTMTQQAIFSCPGCGVRLDTFYRTSIEELRREELNGR